MMELRKCTLSNKDLIAQVRAWVTKLNETGGRAWVLRIPIDYNHDPDTAVIELCQRYARLIEGLEGLVDELESEEDRYGNEGRPEIAAAYGISCERIRQIIDEARV